MSEQVRVTRTRETQQPAEEIVESEKIGDAALRGADILSETDELLDDIDALLEENPEEFVREFKQTGGE